MTPNDEIDELLRARFAGLREADARQVPAFGAMIARARTQIEAEPAVPPRPAAPAPATRWRPWRWALAATPLAAAAAVAAIWLAPSRVAEREFERVVAEWSRTERALTAPTDGLLAVPGSEYLRRLPAIGSGGVDRRRPS